MSKFFIFFLLSLSIISCDRSNKRALIPFDEELGLSRGQFKKALSSDEKKSSKNSSQAADTKSNIPELSSIIVSPNQADQLADGKLVSLSITEDVPLIDIFMELGRLAGVEVDIDPYVSGSVIMVAKDRPLSQIIDRICDIAGLRYSIKDNVLKIQQDIPYVVNYSMDFLDITRGSTSSLQISTKAGSDQLTSGGDTSVTSSSSGDVWTAAINDVGQILSSYNYSGTYVTANPRAGIITVAATKKEHDAISEYISKVRKSATAQVLIEAKIIEVSLSEAFQTGINWANLGNSSAALVENVTSTTNMVSLVIHGTDSDKFSGTLSFIEQFGTTKTLSSPRITALNNQQAILTFTENNVYFEVTYDSTTTTSTTSSTATSISSTLKTVPIGIILSIQPSIDLDRGEVTMSIRPTISSTSESVDDPAVSLIAAKEDVTGITSSVPIVQLKELDTLLKLKSGDSMVIGGLIEQSNSKTESGVPFFQKIPIIGYAMKSLVKANSTTETVILLKATIINPDNGIDMLDQNFYNTFDNDRRHLRF